MRDIIRGGMGRDERRLSLWRDARHQGMGLGCAEFALVLVGSGGWGGLTVVFSMLVVFCAPFGGVRWRSGFGMTIRLPMQRWIAPGYI
jgi:hypothetical protein